MYFVPAESFNLVAMFSNPMMLLMVFGGGMMLAMPYLIVSESLQNLIITTTDVFSRNMDPESLEEFKEQQAKMSGFQNAVASGDLKSGYVNLPGHEQRACLMIPLQILGTHEWRRRSSR